MALPNFSELLNRKASEVEKPKPLPQGTWHFITQGPPKQGKTKNDNLTLEFQCKPIAAGEDVDEEEIKEYGDIGKRNVRLTMYLTDDALWRLRDFLSILGFDKDANMEQSVSQSQNRQFLGVVTHTPSADGTSMWPNITSMAAIE